MTPPVLFPIKCDQCISKRVFFSLLWDKPCSTNRRLRVHVVAKQENCAVRVFFWDRGLSFWILLSVLQATLLTLEVTWTSSHTAYSRQQIQTQLTRSLHGGKPMQREIQTAKKHVIWPQVNNFLHFTGWSTNTYDNKADPRGMSIQKKKKINKILQLIRTNI